MYKACVNSIEERKNIMSEDKQVVICADCGRVIEAGEDRYTLGDRRIVCKDCIDNYARCEECGEYVEEGKGVHIGEIFVCFNSLENDRRYFKCAECGGWFRKTAWNKCAIWNGEEICNGCYEDTIKLN